MRIDTPCFEGFCKMLEKEDGHTVTPSDYKVDNNGFITRWYWESLRLSAAVYSCAWNDAAKVYNSFGR